jgi:hypothetical protein
VGGSEYFADLVFQWVIMPINLTAACQQLCNIQVLRTSVSFPDTKSLAYAKFQEADTVI